METYIYMHIKTYTPFFFFLGNKGGFHRSMCPYHMCLQRPLDMEVREWIPISSPCESNLDHTVPHVTFDCVTRQRLDDYFFSMLPIDMDYSALRDMTGRSVEPKLSGIRVKGRQSDNTSQSSACVRNSC